MSRPDAAEATATLVHAALLREALLTPKPGLVDRANAGSHRDMTLATLLASAGAIRPWFAAFHRIGTETAEQPHAEALAVLRAEGRACEAAMFAATGGVNTHKGAIFAFGLLAAALGRRAAQGRDCDAEAACAEVAAFAAPLPAELGSASATAGERLYRAHRLTGARGEAASGFATVRAHALPAFRAAEAHGGSEDDALHAALLHLLAHNADTNLAARGGLEGLAFVQAQARRLLAHGAARADLEALDRELIARNLSPGGSADLLAVTWFLARLRA